MTLAYIPSPTISQFSIGPVTIHFYALCILLGIVLAVWMTTVHWKRYGGNFDQILDITLVAVPSGIIGARIYHIITTPERFFGPTGDWVRCSASGMADWASGAASCLERLPLGHGVVTGIIQWLCSVTPSRQDCSWRRPWDVWATGSTKSFTARPTILPWGLKLNMEEAPSVTANNAMNGATCPTGTLFHPTFLYEMIWNLIGAAAHSFSLVPKS